MLERWKRLRERGAEPKAGEITPEVVYRKRRVWLKTGAAAVGASAFALVARGRGASRAATPPGLPPFTASPWSTRDKPTSLDDVTSYNNFYEFGTGKSDPKENAHTLRPRPWTLTCGGAIDAKEGGTRRFDIDTLIKMFPLEERIYRFRCVEAWSMVIPWVGFPLASLLKKLAPTSNGKYVAFKTLLDPVQMPGQQRGVLDWPYVEGLRIDEAMHPLTILAVGLYGRVLPNQNGAPIRLVVPWKYGFKSIKSIVSLDLVEQQPPTSWNVSSPGEYGFYSNVNPEVDHPRWSQKKERRIGDLFKKETYKFNGYGEQVASLYSGLDLRKNF